MPNLLSGITKSAIEQASAYFKFRHPRVVEQLFVDFAVCRHMTEHLLCTIFGGMCMHLHTKGEAQRLSRDVDIMTSASAGEVNQVMHSVFDGMRDCQMEPSSPRHPHPIKNLRTYRINYDSRMGGRSSVKVDFLCGFNNALPTEEVDVLQVLGVDCPLKAHVLTRDALLADKMTTLALGGIGLPERRMSDAPKQVYDVAVLARMIRKGKLSAALSALSAVITSRIELQESNGGGGDVTVQNTVEAIQRSVEGFLDFKTAAIMSNQYRSHLENFRTTYLQNGGSRYQKYERINDLFTVLLLSVGAGQATSGGMDAVKSAANVTGALIGADYLLQAVDSAAQSAMRSKLLNLLSHKNVTKEFLSGLSYSQLVLLEAVYTSKLNMSE